MEILYAQGVPQHLFGVSFSSPAQMMMEVLEILSFLQEMCMAGFFAFLDIWQGLAAKNTIYFIIYQEPLSYKPVQQTQSNCG